MSIIYKNGDAVAAFENEFDVLAHGCNCFCTMGSGIARTIRDKYPHVYEADLETEKGDKSKLGKIFPVLCEGKLFTDSKERYIVNAYTQYAYGRDKVHVSYTAIDKVFRGLAQFCIDNNYSICIPKIGVGLAKGDWNIISKSIEQQFDKYPITVYIL